MTDDLELARAFLKLQVERDRDCVDELVTLLRQVRDQVTAEKDAAIRTDDTALREMALKTSQSGSQGLILVDLEDYVSTLRHVREEMKKELLSRALFGDQCYQDRCEGALIEQSVRDRELKETKQRVRRETFLKAADIAALRTKHGDHWCSHEIEQELRRAAEETK